MNSIKLQAGGVYLLCSLPVPEKNEILARSVLPEGFVLSFDAIRRQLYGAIPDIASQERVPEDGAHAIFDLLLKMVEVRANQRLTTIVDAPLLNDEVRAEYARIAEKCGVPFQVLILDATTEAVLAANAASAVPVSEDRLKDLSAKFLRESRFPFTQLAGDDVISVAPLSLPHDKVDVVGDVHGLYDDLLLLLQKGGWQVDAEGVLRHPDNRLLAFLGDLVDRGQQSLEVLRLVKKAVDAGTAICLQGNHEAKLVRFWDMVNFKGISHWTSYASAETGVALLRTSRAEANELVAFLRNLPASMVFEPGKVALLHANVNLFDPLLSTKSDCIYGHAKSGKADTDLEYQVRFDAGVNKYTLFRGHTAQISEQPNVFSLERDQAFAGELALLRLDTFLSLRDSGSAAAFTAALVTQKCSFDFEAYSEKFALVRTMDALVTQKMLFRQEEPEFGFKVYKFTKRVERERLWDTHPYLAKACGLVLDVAGNIIVHPTDRLPVYGSDEVCPLPDDRQVIAVEKLCTYTVAVTRHPYKPGELLLTTEDGFATKCHELALRRLEYVQSLITPRTKSAMLKYLASKDLTLLFDVVKADSFGIVKYSREQQGLYLTGMRSKEADSLPWTEAEMDEVARQIGVLRMSWFKTTFGKLKELNLQSNAVGYVVREYSREEAHQFMLKSPQYLTAKLMGKVQHDKLSLLFTEPECFKKEIPEELYPLVDQLFRAQTLESFGSLTPEQQSSTVRELASSLVCQ